MLYVEKGGEIIPKITGVELSMRSGVSNPLEYITNCPECGTELVRYEGEAKHYCPNQSHCPPQIIGRITHFIARRAMNIDSLGEETVTLLYNSGLIRDCADLYDLKAEQLSVLPRLGDRSAQNIIESIRCSVNVPFQRVLFALGIRFVGETTAKNTASYFRSIDAIANATVEDMCQAEEVGERIAESIVQYFSDETNRVIVERLRKAGIQLEVCDSELLSNCLSGMNFVVSGSFERHSRGRLKELIELHGGRNLSGVSGSTTWLLAGDKIGPEKLKKAKKLGIGIISESDLEAMLLKGDTVLEENSIETARKTADRTSGVNNLRNGEKTITQGTLF
jgi:DNA ligase (NAD+)